MKITKKVTSIVLALMLVISAFAGLSITASAVMPDQDSITLTIHKGDIDQGSDDATGAIGVGGNLTGTTDDEPEDFKALTGQSVTFTIYYVGGMDTPVPATADVGEYDKITDVTTNTSTGEATFSLNNSYTYPDGVTDNRGLYYVEETASPDKVTTKAQSFFVYLPMTTQNTGTANDGVTWNGDVHVYPKNLTTLGGAVLTKRINNAAPSAAGTVDQYPQFTLYEQIGTKDVDSIVDDVEIATITIGTDYTTVSLSSTLTPEQQARYATVEIAQKDGVIAVDGLPAAFGSDGVATTADYYFKETRATTIGSETLPLATDFDFSVAPGTNVDVETRDDNTEVDPQIDFAAISTTTNANLDNYQATKDNSSRPTITKEVQNGVDQNNQPTYTTGDGGSYDIDNDTVTWRITAPLPADIGTHQEYYITDQIDHRLTLDADTPITVTAEDGTTLTANTDYKIQTEQVTVDPDPDTADDEYQETKYTIILVTQDDPTTVTEDDSFPSTKDADDDYFMPTSTIAGLAGDDLIITITTTINDNANPKISTDDNDYQIYNQAILTFQNQYDTTASTAESDEPYVYTGGFNILKVKQEDQNSVNGVMANVEFILQDEDGNNIKVEPVVSGQNGSYQVVADTDSTVTDAEATVITNAYGQIFVKGLAYGTYQLVETKTNNGYQIITTPLTIAVSENSYINDGYVISGSTPSVTETPNYTVKVPNAKQPDLPLTGGMGTILFTVAGLVLIGGAAFFFIRSRKSSKEEA